MSKGKTPEMTVSKILLTDKKFQRVSKGTYGLGEWEK